MPPNQFCSLNLECKWQQFDPPLCRPTRSKGRTVPTIDCDILDARGVPLEIAIRRRAPRRMTSVEADLYMVPARHVAERGGLLVGQERKGRSARQGPGIDPGFRRQPRFFAGHLLDHGPFQAHRADNVIGDFASSQFPLHLSSAQRTALGFLSY